MRRRQFLGVLGGAAAWPLVADAQERERVRRIGVLMNFAADDPESQRRITAFAQGLQQSGWTDGNSVRVETCWATGDAERFRKAAAELLAFAPDVIVASGSTSLSPLLQATRTVPLVFVNAADPVGAGFVESLAQPGGNATGFSNIEYGMRGQWRELVQ